MASSNINVKDLCRLCAISGEFNKDLLDESNKSIHKLIQEFIKLDINANDDLSTKICLNCEEKLLSFNLFVIECNRVQDYMKNLQNRLFEIKIKEENDIANIRVKDEFTAEDIVSAIANDDDLAEFDNVENFNDESLEEVSVATLKKLKRKRLKRQPEDEEEERGEILKFTDILKCNNLKVKDFVNMNCNYCDEEFQNWEKLSTHSINAHNSKPTVYCICGFQMKSKTVVYKHVSEHKVESKNTSKKSNRSKYTNIKDTNLVKFDCNICQKKCSSFYSLKGHCERFHRTQPVVACQCGALLKSKTVLYKHIADHQSPKRFSCDKCPRITQSLSALEKHKQRHIPKEEKIFKCSDCEKIFFTKEAMKSHVRSHIPIEERKQYECDACFMKFTTRSSAASHKRAVHEKIKGYVCDLCGYACGTNGELRQHRAIHSDDKPFICSKCSKRFKTYSNLKTHMDIHEDTSYICYVCSRILNSRRTLKKHLLVHQTECRHICSFCKKAFKRRQTLKVHMSTHTGDKPLSCKWCDERFAYASTLRSHRLRHHPDKMAAGQSTQSQYQGYAVATHVGNEENLKSGGNIRFGISINVSKFESEESAVHIVR